MSSLPQIFIASSSPPPAWLETVQQSPLTPWIGGALLIFIGLKLIKMAAKFVARLIIMAIIAVAGFLGWNWCEQPPDQRSLSSISQDWFSSIKDTDFSRSSIEALVKDSSKLLNEAVEVGRSNGREASKEALQSMYNTLEAKIAEAAKEGKTDAKTQFQQLLDRVRKELNDNQP